MNGRDIGFLRAISIGIDILAMPILGNLHRNSQRATAISIAKHHDGSGDGTGDRLLENQRDVFRGAAGIGHFNEIFIHPVGGRGIGNRIGRHCDLQGVHVLVMADGEGEPILKVVSRGDPVDVERRESAVVMRLESEPGLIARLCRKVGGPTRRNQPNGGLGDGIGGLSREIQEKRHSVRPCGNFEAALIVHLQLIPLRILEDQTEVIDPLQVLTAFDQAHRAFSARALGQRMGALVADSTLHDL